MQFEPHGSPRLPASPTLGVALASVLLLCLLIAAAPVAAHGILEGSSPRANAVLLTPPKEIVLAFNEPVDPAYSTASVRDAAGRSYGSAAQVSTDGRRMVVALREMGPGLYAVRWRVLSAVDGHTTAGTLLFAVGEGVPIPSQPAGPAAPDLRVVVLRWIAFAAALAFTGALTFDLLVLRWALRRLDSALAVMVHGAARPRVRRLTLASGGVFLASAFAAFLVQGAVLVDRPVADLVRPGVLLPMLGETRGGWSLLLFVAMTLIALIPATPPGRIIRLSALIWVVVVTGVIAVLGGPPALSGDHITLILLVGTVYALASILAALILPGISDLRVPEGPWVPVAAGLLLPWGFTISSHAAAGGMPALLLDWLHLVAAAIWVGGLPSLLLVLRTVPGPERAAVGKVLVPRVSALAALALGVMVVTGAYSAWRDVAAVGALVTTAYGRLLLLKLLLVAAVIALGAANRFAYRPRIEAGTETGGAAAALHGFRRSVAAEVTAGALILLIVSALTITPPAAEVRSSQPAGSLTFAGLTASDRVQLSISPAREGWNEFEVVILPEAAPQPAGVTSAVLEVRSLQADLASRVEMTPTARGRFAAAGDYVRGPGWWEVGVTVRRGRGSPAAVSFPLLIAGASRASDVQAVTLLQLARRRLETIRAWREEEQITDGSGHVTRTQFEFQAPDRLRYRTASGSEAVILGAVRYSRARGQTDWVRDALPSPIALDGPYADYVGGAESVQFGRRERCQTEVCRVVVWRAPRAGAAFAAWIGTTSYRIYRLMMVAPEHYMTSRSDLTARVNIIPPK